MNAWFPFARPLSDARVRLVCLPHAGGAAIGFREWQDRLAPDVEVWAAQLPGRGQRFAEAPLDSLEAVLDGLWPAIAPLFDRPVALFGHSMGATLAFELCRRMRASAAATPVHLFVAAATAPHARRGIRRRHDLPTPELRRELEVLGGTPPQVLARQDLLSIVLPTVRADLAVHENYAFEQGEALDLPLTVMAGRTDTECPREGVAAWAELTTGPVRALEFDGGHFFPLEEVDAVCAEILRDLEAVA